MKNCELPVNYPSLYNKLRHILTIDEADRTIRIGRTESGRNLHPVLASLDLISLQITIQFLQIVNLLFLMTAPAAPAPRYFVSAGGSECPCRDSFWQFPATWKLNTD